ncbi:phage-related protein-like protein [Clostridium cellulovorans 743B]|uniref:Phage-related protein-like protein n=1 Tax=Clostridium cellulovorans (strain ATCC 35296 / DSM 3052 / OCM 3 / 743B) TaxID=573061 RepID=D9SSG5_CLOC7|nr:phage-related protein-like protein [Clostridium cellulovorans 743B]
MAANASTVVARIGLDDSGFQQGVSKIQRSLKLVQSEFAVASSRIGDFGKSTDGLRLKADTLNRQMELQKDKVEALTRSYQESVERKGADAKATENLKIKLNYATAELNNMQRELKETTTELNTKSSAWYKLSQSMDKAGERMKAVGEKMSSVGTKLSTAVTLPLLGVGVATTKMAMDAVESENLFEVAMGSMAGDARQWSEETSKALGLNAYNVRKNIATYNSMLTSMGLANDESLKMSEGLTQLSYDMASFYNLKPEEAFEKLKSGISGEAEPLKALGILVNDTTIKTYAYTNGIAKQGAELTEAQKIQARYGAIMQATKNAQGDLGRTMDSPTNKLRIMKEQAQQIGIQFGQILIPVLEKLMNVIKPLMDKFQGLSKEQQETIVKIGLVTAAIGPIILIVGKVITIVGTLSSAIGTVSGAIAAAGGASTVLGTVFTAITGPIGIVIAAVVGLIAIFVALYKNNEDFRNSVNTIWNGIKNLISGVIEGLVTLFKGFIALAGELWSKYGDDIVNIVSTAFKVISSVVDTVLKAVQNVISIVTSAIKGDWEGVWNGIKKFTEDLWNGIKNIIKSVIDLVKGIVKTEFEFIKEIITGIWDGIRGVTSAIWNDIKAAIVNPITSAKNTVANVIDSIRGFFSNLRLPEIGFPRIKLPHFSIEGEFSLAPPSVPYLDVSWYAKGGIFNGPSVIGVGEAGTEAVLPIDRLDDLMAKALSKAGTTTTESQTVIIPINLEGREIARITYPHISNIMGRAVSRK